MIPWQPSPEELDEADVGIALANEIIQLCAQHAQSVELTEVALCWALARVIVALRRPEIIPQATASCVSTLRMEVERLRGVWERDAG